jgi:hypothetical protein
VSKYILLIVESSFAKKDVLRTTDLIYFRQIVSVFVIIFRNQTCEMFIGMEKQKNKAYDREEKGKLKIINTEMY